MKFIILILTIIILFFIAILAYNDVIGKDIYYVWCSNLPYDCWIEKNGKFFEKCVLSNDDNNTKICPKPAR